MIAAATLLATLLAVEPAQETPLAAAPDRTWSQGEVIVRMVDQDARFAHDRRIWRSSLGLSLGSLQTGLGAYGLASVRFDDVMRRSAIAIMLLGAAEVGMGIHGMARLSSMERLQRGPEYEALAADPSDSAAVHALRLRWREDARSARTWRYIMGGGYIAGGVGLAVLGTVFLFPNEGRGSTETLWAFATLGTGMGLVLGGSVISTVPTPIERSYESHAELFGWPSHRRRRRARVHVAPTVGGATVSGRF